MIQHFLLWGLFWQHYHLYAKKTFPYLAQSLSCRCTLRWFSERAVCLNVNWFRPFCKHVCRIHWKERTDSNEWLASLVQSTEIQDTNNNCWNMRTESFFQVSHSEPYSFRRQRWLAFSPLKEDKGLEYYRVEHHYVNNNMSYCYRDKNLYPWFKAR